MTFYISARVSSRDAVEGWYGSRDDSWDDMEKDMYQYIWSYCWYTSGKLFYEANKQNEITKLIYMEA
jgi:hypothetical protein